MKKYEGKYQKMAESFRKDGLDEYSIEKFIRQEMELDEFAKGRGITDLQTAKEFNALPEDEKILATSHVFCPDCGDTSIKKGFAIRKDKFGLVLEGECSKCGKPVTRCVY